MNIYVGNLSWGLKDQDLANLFAPFGEVTSAKIVTDKFTQRSKGFGFVEMPNDEQAQAAIAQLNGSEIEGRNLVVNESRPKEGGSGNGGGGGFKKSGSVTRPRDDHILGENTNGCRGSGHPPAFGRSGESRWKHNQKTAAPKISSGMLAPLFARSPLQ